MAAMLDKNAVRRSRVGAGLMSAKLCKRRSSCPTSVPCGITGVKKKKSVRLRRGENKLDHRVPDDGKMENGGEAILETGYAFSEPSARRDFPDLNLHLGCFPKGRQQIRCRSQTCATTESADHAAQDPVKLGLHERIWRKRADPAVKVMQVLYCPGVVNISKGGWMSSAGRHYKQVTCERLPLGAPTIHSKTPVRDIIRTSP